jgi:hypothetical protein
MFNLAFVKLGNSDEITTYYDKCEKVVKSQWKARENMVLGVFHYFLQFG